MDGGGNRAREEKRGEGGGEIEWGKWGGGRERESERERERETHTQMLLHEATAKRSCCRTKLLLN